jgi:hypothetical protein
VSDVDGGFCPIQNQKAVYTINVSLKGNITSRLKLTVIISFTHNI